jgi:hypothetical protein
VPWSGWKKFANLADRGIRIDLNCFAASSDGFRLDRGMITKLDAWGLELHCTFSCDD